MKQLASPAHQPHLYSFRSFLGSAGWDRMLTHQTVASFLIRTVSLITPTVYNPHQDEAQWCVGQSGLLIPSKVSSKLTGGSIILFTTKKGKGKMWHMT